MKCQDHRSFGHDAHKQASHPILSVFLQTCSIGQVLHVEHARGS